MIGEGAYLPKELFLSVNCNLTIRTKRPFNAQDACTNVIFNIIRRNHFSCFVLFFYFFTKNVNHQIFMWGSVQLKLHMMLMFDTFMVL